MGIFELELWLTCRSHLGDRFSFSEWKTSASEEHANSRLKNRSAQFDPSPGNTVISAIVHTPVGCVLYHIFASNIHHFDPSPSTILKDFRASQVWSTSFGPFTSYFYCSIPIEKTYARSLVLKQASWGLRLANDNGVTLLRLASFQCMMASQWCMQEGENWVPSNGAYWMVNAEENRRMTKNAGSQIRWSLISPLKSSSLAGPRWVGQICVCGCGHSLLTEKTLVEGNTFQEIETFPGIFFCRWECNYSTPGPTRKTTDGGGLA